jgi:hypothetical protein
VVREGLLGLALPVGIFRESETVTTNVALLNAILNVIS